LCIVQSPRGSFRVSKHRSSKRFRGRLASPGGLSHVKQNRSALHVRPCSRIRSCRCAEQASRTDAHSFSSAARNTESEIRQSSAVGSRFLCRALMATSPLPRSRQDRGLYRSRLCYARRCTWRDRLRRYHHLDCAGRPWQLLRSRRTVQPRRHATASGVCRGRGNASAKLGLASTARLGLQKDRCRQTTIPFGAWPVLTRPGFSYLWTF
jgi:hypothetical protein